MPAAQLTIATHSAVLGSTVLLGSHCHLNPIRDGSNRLVFPCSDDDPSFTDECGTDRAVTIHVRRQLRHPVVTVGLRHMLMERTTVPEAPIDEHCDERPSEHDVGPNPKRCAPDGQILSESEAPAIQR